MPSANRLFSKSMKGKFLNFLGEVEKMISVICVQVYSKKLDFPSLKKDLIFKRQKLIFLSKVFYIKIGDTELSFLINGSYNSSKYQRIHFNGFPDKIIFVNKFTWKNMLEYKIGCLGSQRGRLPWTTRQMTVGDLRFQLEVSHCYS